MRSLKQTIARIFNAFFNTDSSWFTLLGIALFCMCAGICNWGHYEGKSHEEPIIYEKYQPGAEVGDTVAFTAVSAEIGGYTEVTTIKTETYGFDYTYYGYIILTDSDGNRIISKKTKSAQNSTYYLSEDTRNAFRNLTQVLDAWVLQVNLSDGLEYKGIVVQNKSASQRPVFNLIFPAFSDWSDNWDNCEALGALQEIEFYDPGEAPASQTVKDPPVYVRDNGILFVGIGVLLILVYIIVRFNQIRQNIRDRKDHAATNAAAPLSKPAASPLPVQQSSSPQKQPQPTQKQQSAPPKPSIPQSSKPAAANTAAPPSKPAASPLPVQQSSSPQKQPQPTQKQQSAPLGRSILECKKQSAIAQEQKTARLKEANRKKLASIIPLAGELELCTALLLTPPQQIKQNIRLADADVLEVLVKELQNTDTYGDTQMREIVTAVQRCAADVLREKRNHPPAN